MKNAQTEYNSNKLLTRKYRQSKLTEVIKLDCNGILETNLHCSVLKTRHFGKIA